MKSSILFGLIALLAISGLAAADEIYIPKNTPTTGSVNSWPFACTAARPDWRYQLIIDAKYMGSQAVTITDIAFAPSTGGTQTAKKFQVRMSHSTVPTSTAFAVNLPNPVQVLGVQSWSWKATANAWSPIGLTTPYNYNGKDRLCIDIRYTGGALLNGFGGGCRYDSGNHDRTWKYGTTGIWAATTGSVGAGSGLKIRITVVKAQIVPSGTAKPGTPLALNLTAAGQAGNPYHVGMSLGQGPIQLGTWKLGLSPDNLLVASTGGTLPTVFKNFTGKLDTKGAGVATLEIPSIPVLKGVRFYAAFLTLDTTAPMGIGVVSPNVLVTIQ